MNKKEQSFSEVYLAEAQGKNSKKFWNKVFEGATKDYRKILNS